MRWILICLALLAAGCSQNYYGTIRVTDPNGTVVKTYEIETTAPMAMEVVDGDVSVTTDSRTTSIFESLALSLGYTKNSGGASDYYGY